MFSGYHLFTVSDLVGVLVHNIVNALSAAQLFSFKWLISCHVNITSVGKKKKKRIPGSSGRLHLRDSDA